MIDNELTKDLHMNLTYKVHALVMLMDKDAEKFLQDQLNLSYNQFLIIFAITENCTSTQKEVAYFANLTEAAVSKQIETLRKLGYLTRIESQKDRREHVLALTSEGQKISKKAKSILQKIVKSLFSVLNQGELTNLHSYLNKLLENISKSTKVLNNTPK
jgi:DNA-binding MarR family transcriptional regulator